MRFRLPLLALLLTTTPAVAQFPPDSTVNLQVLPDTMPVRDVINVMRSFSNALGVRCPYCHVGDESEPLSEFDFVSDDMPAKAKAREMLRMVAAINREWLDSLPRRPTPVVEVRCITCHRGQPRPIMMADLLVQIVDSAGADVAVARYRALRDRFYGGDTYDFRAGPVSAAAATLLRDGRPADARTLLTLNADHYPDDPQSVALGGQVALALGDTAAAIAALERAVPLQPDNQQVRRLLQRLRDR